MQQLDYSSGKLIWRALLAVLVAPFVLVLATDEHITSGHVRGIWTGLLYAIGPVGRWTLVGAIIAMGTVARSTSSQPQLSQWSR